MDFDDSDKLSTEDILRAKQDFIDKLELDISRAEDVLEVDHPWRMHKVAKAPSRRFKSTLTNHEIDLSGMPESDLEQLFNEGKIVVMR